MIQKQREKRMQRQARGQGRKEGPASYLLAQARAGPCFLSLAVPTTPGLGDAPGPPSITPFLPVAPGPPSAGAQQHW